jgi:hypothetical protein
MEESTRPPISAELRRRILVEAGHRCAIPSCRHIEVDIHHIIPWSQVEEHTYENLIALCPNCHRRADRGEIDRKSLRLYKANLRYTHDKFSQFEVDFLFQLYSIKEFRNPPDPSNARGLLLPQYLRILLTRIDEAGFLHWTHPGKQCAGIYIGGINTSPSMIRITEKGIEYVDSLGLNEM